MGTPVSDLALARGTFLRMLDNGMAYVKVDQRIGTASNVQATVAINETVAAGARVWMLANTTGQTYVIVGADDFAEQFVPVPVGAIIAWSGTLGTAPDGFLPCNFAEVSRDGYSLLYGVLGDLYGAGDGVSTFNVPQLEGFIVKF